MWSDLTQKNTHYSPHGGTSTRGDCHYVPCFFLFVAWELFISLEKTRKKGNIYYAHCWLARPKTIWPTDQAAPAPAPVPATGSFTCHSGSDLDLVGHLPIGGKGRSRRNRGICHNTCVQLRSCQADFFYNFFSLKKNKHLRNFIELFTKQKKMYKKELQFFFVFYKFVQTCPTCREFK